jgi:hypothetical protein
MSKRQRCLIRWVASGLLIVVGLGLVHSKAGGFSPEPQGTRSERHPHIRTSIRELRLARRELREADHDFGGHRVEAIKAIDVAINQLEQALEFDRR